MSLERRVRYQGINKIHEALVELENLSPGLGQLPITAPKPVIQAAPVPTRRVIRRRTTKTVKQPTKTAPTRRVEKVITFGSEA